jgi:hypothetical protein
MAGAMPLAFRGERALFLRQKIAVPSDSHYQLHDLQSPDGTKCTDNNCTDLPFDGGKQYPPTQNDDLHTVNYQNSNTTIHDESTLTSPDSHDEPDTPAPRGRKVSVSTHAILYENWKLNLHLAEKTECAEKKGTKSPCAESIPRT